MGAPIIDIFYGVNSSMASAINEYQALLMKYHLCMNIARYSWIILVLSWILSVLKIVLLRTTLLYNDRNNQNLSILSILILIIDNAGKANDAIGTVDTDTDSDTDEAEKT
jgi:hypothetical protein